MEKVIKKRIDPKRFPMPFRILIYIMYFIIDFIPNTIKIIEKIINFVKTKYFVIILLIFIIIGIIGILFFDFHLLLFQSALGEYIKLIGACIGGLAVFWGLDINNKRIMQQLEQNKIAERGQIGTRFKDAILLLSNEKNSVNLSAIYALYQIALEVYNEKKQLEYIHTIHDIFCSYIRENCLINNNSNQNIRLQNNNVVQLIIDKLSKGKKPLIFKSIEKNFNNCNLKDINFKNSHMKNAIFKNADLQGVNFDKSNLKITDFSEANLQNVTFCNAYTEYSNFQKANLQGMKIVNSYLQNCDFNEANLQGINFYEINFSHSIFNNNNFSGTTFQGINFNNAELNNIDLPDREFSYCQFNNVILNNVNLNNVYFYQDNNMQEVKFQNVTLKEAYFDEINLKNASFINTDLSSAHFYIANLQNVLFNNVNFQNTVFDIESLLNTDIKISSKKTIKGCIKTSKKYDINKILKQEKIKPRLILAVLIFIILTIFDLIETINYKIHKKPNNKKNNYELGT